MDGISVIIDGQEVSVEPGTTVLEAALAAGIYIPHLCHHPDLRPVGFCRVCMVEIVGRGMTLACLAPVEPGMVVRTQSPEIDKVRRVAVELLVVNHHADCLACAKNNRCQLQRVASFVGVSPERLARLRRPQKTFAPDESNPFFVFDPNQCILCGICIRTCDEIVGANAIDFAFRGFQTVVSTFSGRWVESTCVSCGECVVRCPVAALVPKRHQQPQREVKTVCPYCGVGCSIYLGVRGERVVSVSGDRHSPVNQGRLCVKGRFGHDFIHHPERLTTPLLRRDGQLVPVGWDEALELIARQFWQYRGDAFAAMASARCTNEENYLMQKFARAVMGTNNIDHCARLCHAPSVAGLARTLGSGAMTNTIQDIAQAKCIFAIGTNTTAAHPVLALKIHEAVRCGAKLIVANPKEIDLARHATLLLQHQPGSDVALLMGMARVIVEQGLHDQQFIAQRTVDFDVFRASLEDFPLDFVAQVTGVPQEKIVQAARMFATGKPASILYAMGITQHTHGTDNVLAISNLALLTGNLGMPGGGVNPLRGQNNVQGACDMGALPNVLPGYQRVDDPQLRAKFEAAWGCRLPEKPGLALTEMFDAILQGTIKAVYLMGENPLLSEADAQHAERALRQLEFFVVQDIFLTETARLAHVVLPAATFAEKDGTFTNTERRVQLVRKAVDPPGLAKPDWWIICQIAQRMGASGFAFSHPAEIMTEIASLAPIYGGISYQRLEQQGLQWPCPSADHPGTPILHTERFATADGKARFAPLQFKPSAELPDEQYPLLLTTDRSLYQYHTGTMTRRVEGIELLDGQEWLRIHPDDAARLQLSDGQPVLVRSRRGEVSVRVKITEACRPGVVSLTFHFAETPTNVLTHAALDPVAKIPETKVCAVRIEPLASDQQSCSGYAAPQ